MRRLAVVGVLVAALSISACGGKHEPLGPTATVPQGTTTTNPYAVPAVIDEAYVNRVLEGLDQAYGEITRMIVETRTLLPEVVQRLNALYVGDSVQLQIDVFQAELLDGLRVYKPSPGNQVSTITSLISVAPGCIFAEIHRDLSAVVVRTDPRLETQWVALIPSADPPAATSGFNPTPWALKYDGFGQGFAQPEDPCVAVS